MIKIINLIIKKHIIKFKINKILLAFKGKN